MVVATSCSYRADESCGKDVAARFNSSMKSCGCLVAISAMLCLLLRLLSCCLLAVRLFVVPLVCWLASCWQREFTGPTRSFIVSVVVWWLA